jgi:hypothetical protein
MIIGLNIFISVLYPGQIAALLNLDITEPLIPKSELPCALCRWLYHKSGNPSPMAEDCCEKGVTSETGITYRRASSGVTKGRWIRRTGI